MSLPVVSPAEVGLDARRLAIANDIVQAGVDQKVYSAAVLLVARRARIAHQRAFGALAPDGPPARVDSIFDLASLTKPCTAVGLLTLLEDGKIALSQELVEWIPESKGTPLAGLTLRQLATHTAGLVSWKPLFSLPGIVEARRDNRIRAAILEEILRIPPANPPGAKYVYSDLGYILLGEVVGRAAGAPLDQYLHSRVFAPMGMTDTGFLPAESRKVRTAATAFSSDRPYARNVGVVHDENANALGGVSGHAGLFGTAPDLAILAAALAGNGDAGGHRLLGLPTLRLPRACQIPPEIGGHSIGWFTAPNPMLPRGDILDDAAFGHTGFTGTMVVIHPPLELAVILLTNRVVYSRDDAAGIARVRRRTLNAVASAVVR